MNAIEPPNHAFKMRWEFLNVTCSDVGRSGDMGASDNARRRVRIQVMKNFRYKERLRNSIGCHREYHRLSTTQSCGGLHSLDPWQKAGFRSNTAILLCWERILRILTTYTGALLWSPYLTPYLYCTWAPSLKTIVSYSKQEKDMYVQSTVCGLV
jgi:hypothetical protein